VAHNASQHPPPLFGANVDAAVADPAAAIARAQLAEQIGFDLVLTQDHPYNPAHLDTWTFLTTVAMRTERIQVGSNVSPLPLRPPAMLAKQVASVAALSGGRVLLGLGAGAFPQGIHAFGGPELAPGAAVAALDEGIRLIRQVWQSDGPASFAGEHHRVRGVRFGPNPERAIPIWVGALRPRMLRLTGRLADGLIVSAGYAPPSALPEFNAQVDAGAAAAGRSPTSVRRAYNVMGRVEAGATTAAGEVVGAGGAHDPATWVAALTRYAAEGRIDTFVFWPDGGNGDRDDQLRRFAADVIPGVRAAAQDVT
jgi:alkanesulfonate monooxygenase SsuD/methylene tetrahydromethanopterin reductase-like flavin-dependent oxidoreductase (luciferase family)